MSQLLPGSPATRGFLTLGPAPPSFVRAFRLLFVRRLVAVCLTVCLGFFSAESLTAEVHDGDATHAELVQADGAREHGAAHRAALVTDAAYEGQPALRTPPSAVGRATLLTARGPVGLDRHAQAGTASAPGHADGGPAQGDGVPEHAGHACHCWHAHVAPLPLAAAAPRPPLGARAPGPADEPAVLRSRADEPVLRPPIG